MSNKKAVAGDPENVPCLKQKKSCSFEQLYSYWFFLFGMNNDNKDTKKYDKSCNNHPIIDANSICNINNISKKY